MGSMRDGERSGRLDEAWVAWAARAAWAAWAASAGVALLLAVLLWRSPWGRSARLALAIKGPRAVPLLGNVLLMTKHKEIFALGCTAYESFGSVFRVWMTLFPMFVVQAPEDVQAILSSHKHTDKISIYRLLHTFVGQGLITSSGHKWQFHRKMIQPNFHISNLEQFLSTFHHHAEEFTKSLWASGPEGINITSYVNNCVLDILNEAVLGISVDEKRKERVRDTPFRKGKVVVPYRLVRPWLLLNWVYELTENSRKELKHKNELANFTKKVLRERREALRGRMVEENQERQCLLDFLIHVAEGHDDFSDEDIVNELCTFMLAGQDSVGAAVAFAIALLAKHGDVQERAAAELAEVFGSSRRPPTRADLHRLRFLEQCIKETLRLFPSVPMMARRLGDDVRLGDVTLPKGAEVIISPFTIHRIEHIYPNAHAFDPDRFSTDKCEGRHPYAFIPFSAGPRNCIGYKFAMMEMKTILSALLRQFQLEPVPGRDSINLKYRLTLRSEGGVWVRLKPRQLPLISE